MMAKLFHDKPPRTNHSVLDPGCGPGAFIAGVIRWCERRGTPLPKIVGYESEPHRHADAASRFRGYPSVKILCEDFLIPRSDSFDYVIGNPPYVPIHEIGGNGERRVSAKLQRHLPSISSKRPKIGSARSQQHKLSF
jgi:tRNA1(Val) A37 N6-methylase TrmN6